MILMAKVFLDLFQIHMIFYDRFYSLPFRNNSLRNFVALFREISHFGILLLNSHPMLSYYPNAKGKFLVIKEMRVIVCRGMP